MNNIEKLDYTLVCLVSVLLPSGEIECKKIYTNDKVLPLTESTNSWL